MDRKKSFNEIGEALKPHTRLKSTSAIIAEGDSLKLLRRLPEHSVSLILTDPPYHTTKKENIIGDTSFVEDAHYIEWMADYAKEWARVLKPNGSLFCFCSPAMAGQLENAFSKKFNVLAQIVWTKPNDPGFDGWKQKMKKESLRQWYSHSERIIFAEPAFDGNLHRSYFGNFLKKMRIKTGLTGHKLTEITGAYGKVNHGGAVSNWEAGRNVPSREQYQQLCDAFIGTGKVKKMPDYEDVIRPFMVNASTEFTDVWNFPNVRPYKGKHPAEKPSDLLEHAIESTTYEGDIVLDCFSGSGSTGFAAIKLGRRAVLMEIDPEWVSSTSIKLQKLLPATKLSKVVVQRQKQKQNLPQLALFQT